MKKKQLCILVFLIIRNTLVNGLGTIKVAEIFNSPTWPQEKEEFSRKLRTGEIAAKDLDFMNAIIEGVDLSGMYFRGALFGNCKLINVDLSSADITEIRTSSGVFDHVNLEGAILYYSLDESGNPILEESYRYEADTPKNLLVRYSNLRGQYKRNKKLGLNTAADRVWEKTLAFIKILCLLSLKIENEDLKDLDLTKLKLLNAKLEKVNFENTNLDKCKISNSKIINCSFVNLTIKKSYLFISQLTNNDFRGADLYGTSFYCSFLDKNLWEGACLRNCNFHKTRFIDNLFIYIISDSPSLISYQNDHSEIREILKWTEIEAPIKFVYTLVDQKNTSFSKENEEEDFVFIL